MKKQNCIVFESELAHDIVTFPPYALRKDKLSQHIPSYCDVRALAKLL